MSEYKGKALGTLSDIGCYSFHETKNYQCGEGGAILVNNEAFIERSEIIREKGTNRSKFLRGQVDKYTWVDIGSSYLPSELNAAFLYAQLLNARKINEDRLKSWSVYYENLKELKEKGVLELPVVPKHCKHNAHMFYIKVENIEVRSKLIEFLKKEGILAVFHYVPLHSSEAGKRFGEFRGEDRYTTKESERLLRLPMYYKLKEEDILKVCDKVKEFFKG
jgi:dTDP-4-amino-4,6-dideoxygalactose transaminase